MKRSVINLEHDSRTTQDRLDSLELSIAQSLNARELDTSLNLLTADKDLSQETLAVYQLAGPAKLLSLVLTGYELPDANTRFVSSKQLSKLLTLLAATPATSQLWEQVSLIIAQQQNVLLEQIEQDIEALQTVEKGSVIAENQVVLANLHKQLRTLTDKLVVHESEHCSWQQLPAFGA